MNIIEKCSSLLLRVKLPFSFFYYKYTIYTKMKRYKKSKIDVLLVLHSVDTWKLDSVYSELVKSDKFQPLVLICPIITKGDSFKTKNLENCIIYSDKKSYEYSVANIETNLLLDYNHPLLIFNNPNPLSYEKLNLNHCNDLLYCYIPYSFRIDSLFDYEFNHPSVNSCWLAFYETTFHKSMAKKYSENKGCNVIATGFPFLDP